MRLVKEKQKQFYRASEVWASTFRIAVIKDRYNRHLIVAGAMFIAEAGYNGLNSKIIYSSYENGSMFESLEKLKNLYFERK